MALNLYLPLDNTVIPGPVFPVEQMQAGEIGLTINIYPYILPIPVTTISLTGATCILAVQGPDSNLSALACTVSLDGTYAYRTTLATDFPVGGMYEIQFIAIYTGGIPELKSPMLSLPVGLSLE